MKVFQGRRADFSWGHLSVEGTEHATESFGKAVWDANDRVVANPNLIVQITVEAVLRPIVPGSTWKSKTRGVARVVECQYYNGDVNDNEVHFASPEGAGQHSCSLSSWYHLNEWVSDPEPT